MGAAGDKRKGADGMEVRSCAACAQCSHECEVQACAWCSHVCVLCMLCLGHATSAAAVQQGRQNTGHEAALTSAIAFRVGRHFVKSVTPESLLVVAPAG